MKLLRPTHPFLPTLAGFLYLAVVVDAWSRKVIGWALADHLEAGLAIEALDRAIAARNPAPDSQRIEASFWAA